MAMAVEVMEEYFGSGPLDHAVEDGAAVEGLGGLAAAGVGPLDRARRGPDLRDKDTLHRHGTPGAARRRGPRG